MARCRWCGIDAESDDVCVWCRRPLYATPGHDPNVTMHRHLPVDNRTSFLPDSIDYTNAFPVMSGLLVIAAIAIGAGFLRKTGDEHKRVNTAGIARDFKAIYSQSDDPPEPDLSNTLVDSPAPQLASTPLPKSWSQPPPVTASARTPNRKAVHLKVGFVTPDETNSTQIAVETLNLQYSTHLNAYVGSIKITNHLREQITDFSVILDIDGSSYRMMPFQGDPNKPEPLGTRSIGSGGTLTCPVIGNTPEPGVGAVKSVRVTAQIRGRGTIEITALAP